MPRDACPERAAVSKPVVDAITEVYRAKAEYDAAKQKHAANVEALAATLQKARNAERGANRSLAEHIKQHGCKS